MSDDTPTQRFGAAGGTPTEPFDAGDAPVEAPPNEIAEERRSRKLMLILGIIGGALLLAIIVLLILLLTRGVGTPVAVATGSATPTTTPTSSATTTASATPSAPPAQTSEPAPPPPPPSTAVAIDFFDGTDQVLCNTQAPNPPSYALSFSWSTAHADQIYFGVATDDAQSGALFTDLPPSGDESDFPYPVEFPCPAQSQTYTITAVGDGGKVSETITVVNNGDTQ